MPSVHISIVVTATPGINDHFGERCVETLLASSAQAPFQLRVTVTENNPGSGVGRKLQQRFPQIRLIENPERRGYAANHNTALRAADADYLVVANDDLEFLPETLSRAVAFLEDPAHADVGVVGFNLRNPDGSLQPSTYRFPTVLRALLDISNTRRFIPHTRLTRAIARALGRGRGRSTFWAHDRTVPVDTFYGALVMVRGAAARHVGFMEELTRVGGEEAEWNQRFWNAGWQVIFLHDAPVVHYGGQTVRGDPGLRVDTLKGWLNFFGKHRSFMTYTSFHAAASVIYAARQLGYRIQGDTRMVEHMRESRRVLSAWHWNGGSR